MDINERKRQLMKVLRTSSSDVPITVRRLAQLLHVSARTVHSDLDALAEEIADEGLHISRKASRGIWLESIGENAAAGGRDTAPYVFSRSERADRIILALLGEEKVSIDMLAASLSISRNTLLTDLKEVQEKLEQRGLTYASKRGLGIWADGGEQEIRDMLIHLFAKAEYDFRRFSELSAEDAPPAQQLFHRYAEALPVAKVADFLIGIMRKWEILENDAALNRMVCALIVQLKRLRTGNSVMLTTEVGLLSEEGRRMRALAEEISAGLRRYHPNADRPEEVQYIVRELLHSKIFLFSVQSERALPKDVNIESLALARRFVEYAQVWLGDIYLDDDELIYNLALHLQPAIERARFGIVLTNPLLGRIREQYSSLFEVTRKAADRISEATGIRFSEDEIGYLTIHIGAAVERKKMRRTRQLSVLLVCGNGVGTANLLAMTLKNNLRYIRIVKTLSFYKLEDGDLEGIDLIISTVPIERTDVAVLRVSPIMTDDEIKVIAGQIQYFYDKKFVQRRAEELPVTAHPGLLALLSEEVIALDEQAADWEEAVRKGGRLLQNTGAVTANYVDCMVKCVQEMGEYIVVCPGVAMPHARYEDGVHAVAVSFLRLKEPIYFSTSKEAIPVDMFFSFSTTDERSHLNMLRDLWRIFSDQEMLDELRSCTSKKVVLERVCAFLGGDERFC